MLKETPVLRHQDGIYDWLRNLAQGDPDLRVPSGSPEGCDLRASGVEADRRKLPLPKVQRRIGPPSPDPDQAQGTRYEEADHT
jgi:hypothetical protein